MIADTTFVLDVLRGDAAARDVLARADAGSDVLRLPSPVLFELWEGLERSRYPLREAAAFEEVVRALPGVDVRAEHAIRAGRVSGSLARRGLRVDPMDALVAGIALVDGEPVVTRNVRDFSRVADLRLLPY